MSSNTVCPPHNLWADLIPTDDNILLAIYMCLIIVFIDISIGVLYFVYYSGENQVYEMLLSTPPERRSEKVLDLPCELGLLSKEAQLHHLRKLWKVSEKKEKTLVQFELI